MRLISDRLVELIEKHSDAILKRWVADLQSDPTVAQYSTVNKEYVRERAYGILKNLREWVSYDTTKEEVGRRYAEEGIEYFKNGIPLCEVVRAYVILKTAVWSFASDETAIDSAYGLHQLNELKQRVVFFFDYALYYAVRGYTEEMNRSMKKMWNLTENDTEKIFFSKSFYNKG